MTPEWGQVSQADIEAAMFFQAALAATLAGIVLGAIPLLVGAFRKHFFLGLCGFISTLISTYFFGAIVGLPLCAFFVYLIVASQ